MWVRFLGLFSFPIKLVVSWVYGLTGGFTMFLEFMNLVGGLASPYARSALLFICPSGNVQGELLNQHDQLRP